MKRRHFLTATSRAAVGAGAVLLQRRAHAQGAPRDERVEERIASWLEEFDSQGNHRTGTAGDNASAEWVVREAGKFGVKANLESFPFNRVDPQSAFVAIGDRRIDGVPLFDTAFTGADGITGTFGPLGSDAEIALADSEAYDLSQPGKEFSKEVAQARTSQHKAVVILTKGVHPGLFLLNANSMPKPSGPPMLQVSSVNTEWLKEMAAKRPQIKFVSFVKRTATQASNVTAKITGSNPKLPPVVVMAPRSAWYQSVTEQGSRMALWLETMRTVAAAKPVRDCLFVSFSGHEVGAVGTSNYLTSRPDLAKGALVWIFFGSDIGSPGQPTQLHASNDMLEKWALASFKKQGLVPSKVLPQTGAARGEAGLIQRQGGQFITVAGDSDAYHNINDRWPDAADVGTLARWATAFADGTLVLANTTS